MISKDKTNKPRKSKKLYVDLPKSEERYSYYNYIDCKKLYGKTEPGEFVTVKSHGWFEGLDPLTRIFIGFCYYNAIGISRTIIKLYI